MLQVRACVITRIAKATSARSDDARSACAPILLEAPPKQWFDPRARMEDLLISESNVTLLKKRKA